MKVLMLAPPPHLRGPLPKHTPHLVAALRELGCAVTVESWGRHRDVESLYQKVLGRIGDIWRIRRALRRLKPDVLVVKTSHEWNTLVRDILLLLGTGSCRPRTVVQLHGSRPEALRLGGWSAAFQGLSRWLVRLSDAVMVLSRDELEKWKSSYPQSRFYVVANAFVDRDGHEDGASRGGSTPRRETTKDHGPPELSATVEASVPVVLFVGRLKREKGIFDLVQALSTIRFLTDAQLLVVGEGREAQRLAARVQELGLADRVRLTGYLEGEELDAAYARASVFVLPTWWMEGFPTVIAEAMHARLPIITTPIRGMLDHLEEGVNALFVPPHDPTALAGALLRLLSDGALRSAMATANRDAVRKFAPRVVGEQYLRVLEDVLA
jgi:glycosyltransferase involved in cell wall biosynthesis